MRRKNLAALRAALFVGAFGIPAFGRMLGVHHVDPVPGAEPAGGSAAPPPAPAPAPINFGGDGGAAGGGDGGGGDGGAAGGSRHGGSDRQLKDAIRRRNKAQATHRALAETIGVDPEDFKLVATNDPANPYRLEAPPELLERLERARDIIAGEGEGEGTGAAGAASKRQPQRRTPSAEATRLQAQLNAANRQRDALIRYITRVAIVGPIRSTCVRMGAIDDDNGQFSDIVQQLLPRFRPAVEFDEDNPEAEPIVSIQTFDASNAPIVDPQSGEPMTPERLTEQFLTQRPKYLAAQYRGGPGAGGAAIGGAHRGGAGVVRTQTMNQGVPPREHYAAGAVSAFLGIPRQVVEERNAPTLTPAAPQGNGNGSARR
jgi:hypothetical protein